MEQRVGKIFLLLFTVVPLTELYLLLALGKVMGFWPTVALVAVTGVAGATLAKREGLRVLRTYQQTLLQGRVPEEGLLGAVLVLVGGVLLLTPGILTDVTGLLLLVPQSRRIIARFVKRRLEKSVQAGAVRVTTFGVGGPGGFAGFGGFGARPVRDVTPRTERATVNDARRVPADTSPRTGETDAEIVDD